MVNYLYYHHVDEADKVDSLRVSVSQIARELSEDSVATQD